MHDILSHCRGLPLRTVPGGTVLLTEGSHTGRAYVLAEGRIEVLRGETQVSVSDEPGSFYGEMSILLDAPHTATVRAVQASTVHVIEDGEGFLRENPQLAWHIARMLASRLNAATTYLADLTHQYEGRGDHLEMVGDVLASLLHEQRRDIAPGSDRDPTGT